MTPLIETTKLSDTVGVEVHGVDVDRLLNDAGIPEWVLETLETHGVLVFRGLHFDDTSQVAFSKRLGKVEALGTGDIPEIFRVTLDPAKNPVAAYLRGTFDWHIDGLTDDTPIKATMLSAHAIAEAGGGGETEFVSTYVAYEVLTDDQKERYDSVRIVHSIEAAQRRLESNPTPEHLAMWRSRPSKEHPLIWQHRSGRRSVVLGPTAGHVVGMADDEGSALIDEALAHATDPDRVYRHVWQLGDLVIWDNRGVLHRALAYDPTSPRDMHRTTLTGDEQIR